MSKITEPTPTRILDLTMIAILALGWSAPPGHATNMTFDPVDIQEAIRLIKNSIEVAGRHRKKHSVVQSVSKMMWKTNYSSYTDGKSRGCFANIKDNVQYLQSNNNGQKVL